MSGSARISANPRAKNASGHSILERLPAHDVRDSLVFFACSKLERQKPNSRFGLRTTAIFLSDTLLGDQTMLVMRVTFQDEGKGRKSSASAAAAIVSVTPFSPTARRNRRHTILGISRNWSDCRH